MQYHTKITFFFKQPEKMFGTLYWSYEPTICHFTDIVYFAYVYLQIILQAHYSHKNSALALIHYMEIPAIM
jgi:hypothetical protein